MGCLPTLAATGDISLTLRYRSSIVRADLLDQAIRARFALGSRGELALGLRLVESKWDLYQAIYAAEPRFALFSFLRLDTRLAHKVGLDNHTSQTQLLILSTLHAGGSVFGAYVSAGWHVSLARLSGATFLPNLFDQDAEEADWAVAIGFRISPTDHWTVAIRLATLEELEVFRLNNPYAEVRVEYRPFASDVVYSLLSRYKVLLGFGGLDEFLLGAELRLPLGR